jgi:hypothetical protein
MTKVFGFSLVLGVLAAACTQTTPEGDDDREAELRIRPRAPSVGRLLVRAPKTLPTTAKLDRSIKLKIDGVTEFPLGIEREIAAGPVALRLDRGEAISQTAISFPFASDVPVGALREVALGAVTFTARKPTDPMVVGLDLFTDSTDEGFESASERTTVFDAPRVRMPASYADQHALRPAGTYHYAWGFADGVRAEVKGDEILEVSRHDLRSRAAIRIVAPKRELPDCNPTAIRYRIGAIVPGANWSFRFASIASEAEIVVAHAPWNLTRAISYVYLPPATSDPLKGIDFKVPTTPGAITELRLGRLDVDDVEIPGSQIGIVRGDYAVFPPGKGETPSAALTGLCPTGTGVDLAPGDYDVVITYDKVGGGNRAKLVERVTVPPG